MFIYTRSSSSFYLLSFIYCSVIIPCLSIELDLYLYTNSKSTSITSKRYIDNDFYYLIPICLGTPPQCVEVLYETNFTHLMMNPSPLVDLNDPFNTQKSSTFTAEQHVLAFLNIQGDIVHDKLQICLDTFDYSFLYNNYLTIKTRYKEFDGVFGFGKSYNDKDIFFNRTFSLVELLYQQKKIPSKIFGHRYFGDRNYLRLFIGEITDDDYIDKYVKKKNTFPKCSCHEAGEILGKMSHNQLNQVWSCMLNKAIIFQEGNESVFYEVNKINTPVIFSTGSNLIRGPLEYGKQIFEYILNLPQYKDKCKEITYGKNKLNIICSWTIDIYNFPKIKFDVGGTTLIAQPYNYLYKVYDSIGDKFVFKGRFEFGDDLKFWSFGQSVLREYDMIFDMENEYVGFWNIEKEPWDRSEFLGVIGWISFGMIMVVLGTLGVIWFLRWKNWHSPLKQKERMMYDKIEKLKDIEE